MRRQVAVILRKPLREKIILDKTKKSGDIIYGARAIQKHLGTISRPTEDYDIFSNNPKGRAKQMDKKLDSLYGFDYHYVKKGQNPGTWKVKGRGLDMKKGTEDDEGVVDYTKTPKPAPKSVVYNGIKYRVLSEEAKGKRQALRDKKFAFRHEKDRRDLDLINSVKRAAQMRRPAFPKTRI